MTSPVTASAKKTEMTRHSGTKETNWLSRNMQVLCGVTLGAAALGILWKLGAFTTSKVAADAPLKWKPLTKSDTAEVKDFNLEEYVYGTESPFDKKIIEIFRNSTKIKADLPTLFNFCVNNQMSPCLENPEVCHADCAERAFKALMYKPELISEDGFQSYYPTLTKTKDGQWAQKAQ